MIIKCDTEDIITMLAGSLAAMVLISFSQPKEMACLGKQEVSSTSSKANR